MSSYYESKQKNTYKIMKLCNIISYPFIKLIRIYTFIVHMVNHLQLPEKYKIIF